VLLSCVAYVAASRGRRLVTTGLSPLPLPLPLPLSFLNHRNSSTQSLIIPCTNSEILRSEQSGEFDIMTAIAPASFGTVFGMMQSYLTTRLSNTGRYHFGRRVRRRARFAHAQVAHTLQAQSCHLRQRVGMRAHLISVQNIRTVLVGLDLMTVEGWSRMYSGKSSFCSLFALRLHPRPRQFCTHTPTRL
jgi:hypothetical protein